jgi:hypothetical protein
VELAEAEERSRRRKEEEAERLRARIAEERAKSRAEEEERRQTSLLWMHEFDVTGRLLRFQVERLSGVGECEWIHFNRDAGRYSRDNYPWGYAIAFTSSRMEGFPKNEGSMEPRT